MDSLSDSELALFMIQCNSIYQVKTFFTKTGTTVSIKSIDEIYYEMGKRSSAYWDKKINEWRKP